MKHSLLYSGLRLLLLIVVGGLAYSLGARGLMLLVLAFVVSGVLSIFVLRRPRSELGTDMGGFFRRINDRIDAATAAEDAPLEQAGEASGSQPGVRVETAEEQVDAEVVEPEHHKS